MTVPFEKVEALEVSHGFFGRQGGVSAGDFAGLNMSLSVGDDPDTVAENRRLAMATLGAPPAGLALLRQTHSVIVHAVGAPPPAGTEGDALVTATPGITLGILTADCTPILLADREAGVIGAAHAGWKGAAGGIAYAVTMAMVALGADPDRIVAVIGPTISRPNYEVGESFKADFLKLQPDAVGAFETPQGGVPHFDLPGTVAEQLRGAGVGRVIDMAACTYARPDRYFSHRYATHQGTRTGRQLSLIGLA